MRFQSKVVRRTYFQILGRDRVQCKNISIYCKRKMSSRSRFIRSFQSQIGSLNRYSRDNKRIGSICQLSLKKRTQSLRIRLKSKKQAKISLNKKNKLFLIRLSIQYLIQKWVRYSKKQKISKVFLRINPREKVN